jgi:hypothetical protein
MEIVRADTENDPPATTDSSSGILGLLSLVLAIASAGSIPLAIALGAAGKYVRHDWKEAVPVLAGLIWIGGMFLALLGVVFGALALRGRPDRRIEAVIGLVVCGCLLLADIGFLILGLVVQRAGK